MMYEGVVYFAGAMTLWGGKVAEKEIVFRTESPMLWATRLRVRSVYGPLDHDRCGYLIKHGDTVIEHSQAADELAPVPA